MLAGSLKSQGEEMIKGGRYGDPAQSTRLRAADSKEPSTDSENGRGPDDSEPDWD